MARFTQTGTATEANTGAFVQLSSTYAGGSVNIKVYANSNINYCIGEYANSAAVVSGAKVNIIPISTYLDFGPVDPKKMWIRSNGATASIIYWDTVS
jgi:hypothetical protein